VYAYPSEFYELWSRERPELALSPGMVGENLTTEGLLDSDVSIGDRISAISLAGNVRLLARGSESSRASRERDLRGMTEARWPG
jgi:hypothetical protein